jgi:hypothetical protein
MAINVSGLTAYVDEQRLPLIKKAVLNAKSAQLFNLQTGCKGGGKTALNLLTTNVVFGSGEACGFTDAGSNVFSQRYIEAGAYKVNMSFCDKSMAKYWMGYEVKTAAGKETLPFEQDFVENIIAKVNEGVEKAIWKGDTTSLDANLNKADGLLKILANTNGVIVPAVLEATTVKGAIDAAYLSIPVEVLPTASIAVGQDAFRTYVLALSALNLYHYNPEVDGQMEVFIPGTTTKVYGLSGLNGTKKVVAADMSGNIFFGTDMEGDEETFDLWYSKDNQEFRLAINFAAGVQVAFPDQVVLYGYSETPAPVVKTDGEKVLEALQDVLALGLAWNTDQATTITAANTAIAVPAADWAQGVTAVAAAGTGTLLGDVVVTITSGTVVDKSVVIADPA